MKKMYGMDTETPLGRLGCIATDKECVEASTFEEVITFLFKKMYYGSIFWTFNLQFDIEHILKSTNDKPFLQDLYENGVRRPGIEYQGCGEADASGKPSLCKIQYIPRKLFKICKNHRCITVYDIAQFYNGASLEKASQQYLHTGKLKDVDAQRIGEEEGYYDRNKDKILEYCQRDAKLTLDLAKVIEARCT
jgi:hypothetical protein